jgi:hypothetical protein
MWLLVMEIISVAIVIVGDVVVIVTFGDVLEKIS